MRTTLDLPKDLLQDAMKASGSKTKTSAIILALQDLVRKGNMQKIKAYKGRVPLQVDLDTLRKRG
ncbi:MAG: type II toxin-antitoxin system VapB family antitoxin [Kiritimatiellia bacterium]